MLFNEKYYEKLLGKFGVVSDRLPMEDYQSMAEQIGRYVYKEELKKIYSGEMSEEMKQLVEKSIMKVFTTGFFEGSVAAVFYIIYQMMELELSNTFISFVTNADIAMLKTYEKDIKDKMKPLR